MDGARSCRAPVRAGARAWGGVLGRRGADLRANTRQFFRTLGCDFFVTSLHKGLGAPVGNGMLIARRDRIASTWPLMAPFEDVPHRIDKFDHWNLGTYNSAL